MRVLDLACKDLLQMVRDWKAAAFLVAMPIVFTLLFGFLFSDAGDGDPRLPVGYQDSDGGVATVHLLDLLDRSSLVRLVDLGEAPAEEIERRVADDELAAAIQIPPGYSEQVLAGEEQKLPVILDRSSSAGHSAQQAIEGGVGRFRSAVEIARLAAERRQEMRPFEDAANRRRFVEGALEKAMAAWQTPPVRVVTVTSEASEGDLEETRAETNGFAHSSPSMMVQFSIAGLISAAEVLVLERRSKSLRRLLTTAMSRSSILAGHLLAIFVMIFVQLLLLTSFGQFVLGLAYLSAPLATVIMMGAMAFWVASLGLLIGVVAKGEEQAIMISMLLMFLLSGLGGAWMPLETTPQAFQSVGRLLPSAWSIIGFENILIRGLGMASVWLPAGVMLIYALGFLALATWRFRFE